MSERKFPAKSSPEAREFLRLWDASDNNAKRSLCEAFGATYERGKHIAKDYRDYEGLKIPKKQPFSEKIPWGEQIEIFSNMDRLVGIHTKVPSEVTIEIDTAVPVAIIYTADWQLGEPGVDYKSFKADMETIRDTEGVFCEVGGDGYENLIQPSKMGSSHNQIPIAPQRGLFVLTLKELGDKVKVLRTGNHNYWSTLAVGEDWERELCRRLKLLYMKHYGIVNWKIGNMYYKEVAMHKGRFNSSFNPTHSPKQHQRMDFPDARIMVVEHNHVADIEQYRYNDQECVAIRTGTYSTYSDYAQQNSYFGATVCNPTVVLYPNEDKIVGFKDFHDAIIYIQSLKYKL